MKIRLLTLTALLFTTCTFAQDNLPYAEKAAQIQKEIWGNAATEFKATAVPANMANESAVVLARAYTSQRTSSGKFKFMIITAGVATRTIKLNTLHERVKINDKVSLESYSTLEYQKKLDKTTTLMFVSKIADTHNTYIGAKIIKPDGKEIIVNTSEEVLTKNESKDQHGKLAIPGLQVGDILDYYISTSEMTENGKAESYKDNDNVIVLADEYPVLYYSIDFQFSKKVSVRYIYANGAPHFEENHNDAGDLLLSLKVRNIKKLENKLWTSTLRQYPYIEIGSSYSSNMSISAIGDKKITGQSSMLDGNKLLFESQFAEYPGFDAVEKKTKEFFKTGKPLKTISLDSVMKVIYDEWKFNTFCSYEGDELDNVGDLNYRTANSRVGAMYMCMMLTDMNVDHDVLLVSSRNSNTLENVYNMNDFSAMIRVNGPTPMYMAFDDIVTHFNEIPARYQGERAVVMHPKRHGAARYTFTYDETTLPVTTSDKNHIEENLQVSLLPATMQKVKIERTVKQIGSLRHDDQKILLPVQMVDAGYREIIAGETLAKRLSQNSKTKKMATDFSFSFDKEQGEMSKNFTNEIKGQYDQEPQQVTNCKIINAALESSSPVFQYSSSFVLDNLVKKAGNNYIIDAGKLSGSFLTVDAKEKKRDVDVYMPSARSFTYTIAIAIPQGYSAKGMEEMNVKKANKTGSFTSSVVLNGNTLTITVKRVYSNNFEKVADWPLLLDLIETASNFNTQKILLEKKG